jgi:hypothetical protein
MLRIDAILGGLKPRELNIGEEESKKRSDSGRNRRSSRRVVIEGKIAGWVGVPSPPWERR